MSGGDDTDNLEGMTGNFIGKPKVRFLTCLWGREHRAEWLVLSLPSLLATGNLPALAAHTDLEVVILTDRKSVRPICGHPAFRKLDKLCQVRFLLIDDLIVGTTYGATLTLAYARGIMDAGAEQTRTAFVFMNSDFIVADGSLATLAGKILEGQRCIVAPSLRASAEKLLPELRKAVKENQLSLKPRALVEMALANLHLTTLGKIAGSKFQCVSFNQVYWRLGQSTLLGRYHLLFMLCIRPERPLGPVNSYCDYGFIPELVPSSPLVPLTDSDEFFVLELGPEHQEADLLRPRHAKPGLIARRLREWTTNTHRQSADFDFIFHSGPLPKDLSSVSKKAASFIAKLHAKMAKRPVSHVNHHYWVRGLQHWLRAKAAGPIVQLPPELAGGPIAKWLVPYARLIAWMQGTPPDVPIRAYDWNDYQLVQQWFSSLGDVPEKSVLFACQDDSRLRGWLSTDPRVEILTAWNHHTPAVKNSKRYRYILLHVHVNALRKPNRVLKPLLGRLASGGEIAIFVGGQRRRPDRESINPRLTNFIRQFLWQHSNELSWDEVSVNGYLQRLAGSVLFKVSDMSFDDFLKGRPRWAPIGIFISLGLISAITILNVCSVDRLAVRMSGYRSAALLRCRRLDETTE
jgi:hypothetical protein